MVVRRVEPVDHRQIVILDGRHALWETGRVRTPHDEERTGRRAIGMQQAIGIDEGRSHDGENRHQASPYRERPAMGLTMRLPDYRRVATRHIGKFACSNGRLGCAAAHQNVPQESNHDTASLGQVRPPELADYNETVSELMGEDSVWRLSVAA